MGRRPLAAWAIGALVLAWASLPQGIGWNQNANYALVRALGDGTAVIDPYRDKTGDVSWLDGHYYSTKPPGLAFATLPAYAALEATGLLDLMARVPGVTDEAVGALWVLGLVGCVLPGAMLLLLFRRLSERLAPGYGAFAAVVIGGGTLLLPFSTLFFAHVLSAALGFAAFALLWLERERGTPARPQVAAAAGLLAGLGIVAHYMVAVVAAIVCLYALATRPRVRTAAVYAAGTLVGVAPLVLYNWWALGSPAHLSYRGAVLVGGTSGHDVLGANASGFFGVGAPSLSTCADLLFGRIGLVTMAPVVLLAAGGVAVLYRQRRAEAIVSAAVVLSFVAINSGYVDPFGGFSPGPRFLIPVLPFLAIALAVVVRRLPATTIALGAISMAVMGAVTITQPLLAYDGRWLERIENGHFGGHGLLPVVPFVVLLTLAAGLAVRASPRPTLSLADGVLGAVAPVAWLGLFVSVQPGRPLPDLLAAGEVLAASTALVAGAALVGRVAARAAEIPEPALGATG